MSSQLGASAVLPGALPALQSLAPVIPSTLAASAVTTASVPGIPPPGIAIPQQIRAPVPIIPSKAVRAFVLR